eukprot:Lankesteria_metandrocarpae@DN8478_c0_g1_i1.p1
MTLKMKLLMTSVALLSNTFAQIRMYEMDYGTPTDDRHTMWVYGDDNVNMFHKFFQHRQCALMSTLNSQLNPDAVRRIVAWFANYEPEMFHTTLRMLPETLGELPRYSNKQVKNTITEMETHGFTRDFALLADGRHFNIDSKKTVNDHPQISWWDNSWCEMTKLLGSIIKDPTRGEDPVVSLIILQFIGRLVHMQPYLTFCAHLTPFSFNGFSASNIVHMLNRYEMGISEPVYQKLKQFPYVKGYNRGGDVLFHSLQKVDDEFFIESLKFTVKMIKLIDVRFNNLRRLNLKLEFNEKSREFHGLISDDVRWMVSANGSIFRIRINSGGLVKDIGGLFDSWFNDWLQLLATTKSLARYSSLSAKPLSYVQDMCDDYTVARGTVFQVIQYFVEHKLYEASLLPLWDVVNSLFPYQIADHSDTTNSPIRPYSTTIFGSGYNTLTQFD